MATNKEIYHEGWLIKSPPTKRIWRARWRRRWFTLKQGELPGQFFLEYYADRKCRKLKGTIDLDQCEQVDAGLRLDRQKEKYAHMFDVKTPTRTYYLAADTEEDMRGWVNCICQVCSLQETQTVDDRPYYNIGAINMADAINMAETVVETRAPTRSDAMRPSVQQQQQPGETDVSNETEITMLNHSAVAAGENATDQQQQQQQPPQMPKRTATAVAAYNPYGTYQNEEMMGLRSMDYTNRETIICEAKLQQPPVANAEAYSNLDVIIERSQSLRGKLGAKTSDTGASASSAGLTNGGGGGGGGSPRVISHLRSQSLNIEQQQQQQHRKKIPENLKLTDRSPSSAFDSGPEQPSPALSTSSGPYIPISECYSGSPVTPLNSLDPRFYETPRSHTNVGFNLVSNEQPYSPKRNNIGGGLTVMVGGGPSSLAGKGPAGASSSGGGGGPGGMVLPASSGKSSPSDSESVFTDDEWTAVAAGAAGGSGGKSAAAAGTSGAEVGGTLDRNTRPSDSSIENDAVGWTYVQRFSKVPNSTEDKQQQQSPQQQQQQQQQKGQPKPPATEVGPSPSTSGLSKAAPPRPPKRTSLNLEGIEKSKDFIPSDTENVSPAIGPKEASAHIEQFYDIPRSHQHPYMSGSSMHHLAGDDGGDLLSPLSQCDLVASSTPNLVSEFGGTLGRTPRPHAYTNAAPTKIEGNVFRFDFSEQPDSSAPAINRRLKPRSTADIAKSIDCVTLGLKQQLALGNSTGPPSTPAPAPPTPTTTVVNGQTGAPVKSPPTVDRTRKPATPKFGTNSMRRKGGPVSLNLTQQAPSESTDGGSRLDANISLLSSVTSPRLYGAKNEDRLQYLDLDHSSSPQKPTAVVSANCSGPSSIGGFPSTSGGPGGGGSQHPSSSLASAASASSSKQTAVISPMTAAGAAGGSSAGQQDGGVLSPGASRNHHHANHHHHHPVHHKHGRDCYDFMVGVPLTGAPPKPAPQTSHTAYTTVDFVKTDAFNRVRADSEMTRAQSRLKDQSS